MERRYLDRLEWTRVENAAFCGYTAAIWIDGVKSPLIKDVCGRLTLADAGYLWVQLLPEGKNWALTVIYNEQREVLPFYFDITLQNPVSEGRRPCFDGLYLDVAFFPDGSSILLDEGELGSALRQGKIGEEEAAIARQQAQTILQKGQVRELMGPSRSLLKEFEP